MPCMRALSVVNFISGRRNRVNFSDLYLRVRVEQPISDDPAGRFPAVAFDGAGDVDRNAGFLGVNRFLLVVFPGADGG